MGEGGLATLSLTTFFRPASPPPWERESRRPWPEDDLRGIEKKRGKKGKILTSRNVGKGGGYHYAAPKKKPPCIYSCTYAPIYKSYQISQATPL